MNEVFVCAHKILQLQSNYTQNCKTVSYERTVAFGTSILEAVERLLLVKGALNIRTLWNTSF